MHSVIVLCGFDWRDVSSARLVVSLPAKWMQVVRQYSPQWNGVLSKVFALT